MNWRQLIKPVVLALLRLAANHVPSNWSKAHGHIEAQRQRWER